MLSVAVLPYLAAALIIVVLWALACLMYGAVRSGAGAWLTFAVGLVIIAGVPVGALLVASWLG